MAKKYNEQFVIQGLRGEKKLRGSIAVKGAKNAVLKSMAASILFDDPLILGNVPQIEDVERMAEILRALGASASRAGESGYTIDARDVGNAELDDGLARRLRASIVFSGPLLGRFGRASFPHPGGDLIGPRPINLFLEGFKAMGCEVAEADDRYTVTAQNGLRGAEIFFLFVTVTGTETLMMAATQASGKTVLKNAAMEPEITALAEFLNACGAKIAGAGTPTIEIEGGGLLRSGGRVFHTIPDRIEAGTFMLLGALAAEELAIEDCEPKHCDMLIRLLRESGTEVETGESSITVKNGSRQGRRPLAVRTHEYPGFATDLQPPMVVYLTQAPGESTMFETIWGGRLNYTGDLVRMGADITLWNPQQITIKGPTPLRGQELESPDIRAGLAYLMAAAIAEGTSTVHHIYHIDRGYEKIEERLQAVGLDIRREADWQKQPV